MDNLFGLVKDVLEVQPPSAETSAFFHVTILIELDDVPVHGFDVDGRTGAKYITLTLAKESQSSLSLMMHRYGLSAGDVIPGCCRNPH